MGIRQTVSFLKKKFLDFFPFMHKRKTLEVACLFITSLDVRDQSKAELLQCHLCSQRNLD